MDDFDDSFEDEGANDEYAVSSYEHIVFLIDAGRGMLEKAGVKNVKGFDLEDTFMDLALKSVEELMKQHIISNPKNSMAVCFYGTAKPTTESFGSVHVFQDMDELSAARIQAIRNLRPSFEADIGSAAVPDPAHSLEDGLWQASGILKLAPKYAGRRLIVFTTQEDPSGGDGEWRGKLLERVNQMRTTKGELELFNLTPEGQDFSMKFWRDLVGDPDEVAAGVAAEYHPIRIQDIKNSIKARAYKKRALASTYWALGGIHVGVKLYSLVNKAGRARVVTIDRDTNEQLRSSGAYICKDTGTKLEKITKFAYPKTDLPRFPRVVMDADQRKAIKGTFETGLELVGFKDLNKLEAYHQLRPSTFLYADEVSVPGSARTLIALHSQLVERGKFALCQVVRTANSEPRLAAVVPQEEQVNEAKQQVQPPGFNIIWLPYCDDIRHPESDSNLLGRQRPAGASEAQISAAAAMVEKLQLPDYVPCAVPNPHLQRHYQIVECLAFGEAPPELGKRDDLTLPDEEGLQSRAQDQITAFKNSIYGEGFDGAVKSKKRKADDDAPIDWRDMAKKGTLSKLTLQPLKAYCVRNHLSQQGRKDDIVERVMEHLGF